MQAVLESAPSAVDRILANMRHEDELQRALRVHPHTRYFRRHVPSGRIDAVVVTPAAVRAQIGPFDAQLLDSAWKRSSLLEFISNMNRLGAGTWVYWPAT